MSGIDAHVHLGRWPRWNLDFSLEDLKRTMARYGLDGAVVTPALVGGSHDANLETLKQIDGESMLYFFPWIPTSYVFLLDNIEKVRGMKFHPSIDGMSILDPRMEGFLGLADEKRLPLLYHCGRNPVSWADPVKSIASSYPGVRFILAHLGGNAMDRILETMELFSNGLPENVYFESSTARHPKLLVKAVAQYGEDRVMFGSDSPFTDWQMTTYCIELAGLDRNEAFMGGNLKRLLTARQ